MAWSGARDMRMRSPDIKFEIQASGLQDDDFPSAAQNTCEVALLMTALFQDIQPKKRLEDR